MREASQEPAVRREGDFVVIRRGERLPPLCILSGEPATHVVTCLFHYQERPACGDAMALLRHYVEDVWKAKLDLPMADHLLRRRPVGRALFALTAILAAATVVGLLFGQTLISEMPPGAEKQRWEELGVPVSALGGFLLTGLAAFGSYKIKPMPTKLLKAVRIDESRVWLAGASPAYLDQLPGKHE